jgi:hypothetical protein
VPAGRAIVTVEAMHMANPVSTARAPLSIWLVRLDVDLTLRCA